MYTLNTEQVNEVNGAGTFGDIGAGLGAAAVVAGGLAAIPSPASIPLAGFAVISGLLGGGAAWLDTKILYLTSV